MISSSQKKITLKRQQSTNRFAMNSIIQNSWPLWLASSILILVSASAIHSSELQSFRSHHYSTPSQIANTFNTNYLDLTSNNNQNYQPQQTSQSHQQQQQQSVPISSNLNHQQQQQAPLIRPFVFGSNIQEGHRTSVMCATARGDSLQIRWFKDNQLLTPELAQALKILIKFDNEESTLKFNPVKLEHAGNYTCNVTNQAGTHSHTDELLVHSEPRWSQRQALIMNSIGAEPMIVSRGQMVVIDCQSIGWPKPNQTWSIKTPSQKEFQSLTNDAKHFIASNGSLIIKNAAKSDEANYLCKAHNGIGRGIFWSTSLKVNVPAYFDSEQRQQKHLVRKQTSIQLRCDAHGDEPLQIEWHKDRQKLMVDSDPRYTIHMTKASHNDGLISVLIIKQTLRNDNSLFECFARNQAGKDKLQIELIVQEEPDNIQSIQASQISPRSVTLTWQEPYDGKSPITSYMIQYKRLYDDLAVAGSGASDPNIDQQQQQQLLYVTTNPLISDLEQQQANIETNNLQQQHQQPLIKQNTIADDWQQAKRLVLPVEQLMLNGSSNQSKIRSFTIEKLEPSSKYVVRALAINGIGQSKFSQPFEFVTNEDAPEVAPGRIKATAINSTSILVSWDELAPVRGRNSASQVFGYYVGYRMLPTNHSATSTTSSMNQQQTTSNTKSYTISDLVQPQQQQHQLQQQQPSSLVLNEQLPLNRLEYIISDLKRNTPYEITVHAFNSQGSGPPGEPVVCKTIEMEAPKPVKLHIRRESNESIFLEWHRDPNDQNPVEDYVLFQEKNSASKELAQVRLPGNQTQYKAPGLKCGTRYQFYVIAQNRVGKSRASELVSASTSGAAPIIPSKTSLIKMINATCLEINLNAVQDKGCRIKTFTVRYRTERVAANGSSSSQSNLINVGNGPPAQQQALSGMKTIIGGDEDATSGSSSSGNDWITLRPRLNSIKHQGPFQRLAYGSGSANPEDESKEILCNLNPTGEYTIHVAAANDVGRSEVEYTVSMASDELRYSFFRELGDSFAQIPNLLAYIPSLIVFLLAGLFVCLCGLILYTTAIKYYQKFIIMQNQIRATKRAKADERRRRKLNGNSSSSSSRLANQNKAELWTEEFDDDDCEPCEDDDGDDENEPDDDGFGLNDNDNSGLMHNHVAGQQQRQQQHNHHRISMLMQQADEDDDLTSGSCSSNTNSSRRRLNATRSSRNNCRRTASMYQHQQQVKKQQQFHFVNRSQQFNRSGGHYGSNLHAASLSGFDSSSLDSSARINAPIVKSGGGQQATINNTPAYGICHGPTKYGFPPAATASINKMNNNGKVCSMSTASTDSIQGPFQCLNSKQYVKMNEYTMMPSISGSLSNGQQAPMANDIYGTTTGPPVQHQNNNANCNINRSSSIYYSTLRRTNMQTYLPPGGIRQHQQQQQSSSGPGQAINLTTMQSPQRQQQQAAAINQYRSSVAAAANDIYGYHYVTPKFLGTPPQSNITTTNSSPSGGTPMSQQSSQQQQQQQQQQDEAANSIFVPPQQIIYSAPNIRHQPSVFL